MVLFVTTSSSEEYNPPPWSAVLPLTVLFVSSSVPHHDVKIPPPQSMALFPLMVLLLRSNVPLLLWIPPPEKLEYEAFLSRVFPLMVLSVAVRVPPLLKMPPPMLAVLSLTLLLFKLNVPLL